jgi:Zn-dependent protease with chaperone function
MAQINRREERTLGDLFAELSEETSMLIRQEMQLAKAEVSQKVSKASKNITVLAVGGIVAYVGFLALTAALILGLAELMTPWLAALLVGIVMAVIGYFLIQKGISTLKQMTPVPERTVASLKEDVRWLKQEMS